MLFPLLAFVVCTNTCVNENIFFHFWSRKLCAERVHRLAARSLAGFQFGNLTLKSVLSLQRQCAAKRTLSGLIREPVQLPHTPFLSQVPICATKPKIPRASLSDTLRPWIILEERLAFATARKQIRRSNTLIITTVLKFRPYASPFYTLIYLTFSVCCSFCNQDILKELRIGLWGILIVQLFVSINKFPKNEIVKRANKVLFDFQNDCYWSVWISFIAFWLQMWANNGKRLFVLSKVRMIYFKYYKKHSLFIEIGL